VMLCFCGRRPAREIRGEERSGGGDPTVVVDQPGERKAREIYPLPRVLEPLGGTTSGRGLFSPGLGSPTTRGVAVQGASGEQRAADADAPGLFLSSVFSAGRPPAPASCSAPRGDSSGPGEHLAGPRMFDPASEAGAPGDGTRGISWTWLAENPRPSRQDGRRLETPRTRRRKATEHADCAGGSWAQLTTECAAAPAREPEFASP